MLSVLCIFFYYWDMFEDTFYKMSEYNALHFLKAYVLIINLEVKMQISVLFLSQQFHKYLLGLLCFHLQGSCHMTVFIGDILQRSFWYLRWAK